MKAHFAPLHHDVKPTGIIIVRLQAKYAALPGQTLLDASLAPFIPAAGKHHAKDGEALPDLANFLREYELMRSTRLVITATPERVAQLEQRAAKSTTLAPIRSLLQYWRVDARHMDLGITGLRQLADSFKKVPGVSTAYVQAPLVLPATVVPEDDPWFEWQFHLLAPPKGIDAKYLWDLGYDGAGVSFVDVEGDWFLHHLDLPNAKLETIPGDAKEPGDMRHGTGVLGVVAAVDNKIGVVGVAPGVARVVLSSVYRNIGGANVMLLTDAIVNAIDHSAPGDVVLIEWQAFKDEGFLPVEEADDAFDALRLAAALGRIVVEAAGNEGISLDGVIRDAGYVLARGVRDSGAIIVAASKIGPGLTPRDDSNYGTRVDCFAPGESIATCDYDDSGVGAAKSSFRKNFAQTSAASSVVAGAAVLFQSAWKARTGALLGPLQLRDRFSDPALNWPQGYSTHAIGRMPNLRKIIDVSLPDIYLRDTVLDDGHVPSAGVASVSPDLIVRQAPVANPVTTFGESSGTAGNAALSQPVVAGRPHFIYARLRNRGGVDALGATVKVYWSPPASLIMPSDWHPIGTTPPFDVPAGDTLAVSQALVWPALDVPGPGHYCFIGLASQAKDTTLFPGALTWDQFLGLVRNNNNIAWRNFDVIDPLKAVIGEWLHLPFLLRGAPDISRLFTIRVDVRFVQAAVLWLEIPESIVAQFGGGEWGTVDQNQVMQTLSGSPFPTVNNTAMIDIGVAGGVASQSILLDPEVEHQCALRIRMPVEFASMASRISVGQFFHGLEVGRLTWSFNQG